MSRTLVVGGLLLAGLSRPAYACADAWCRLGLDNGSVVGAVVLLVAPYVIFAGVAGMLVRAHRRQRSNDA